MSTPRQQLQANKALQPTPCSSATLRFRARLSLVVGLQRAVVRCPKVASMHVRVLDARSYAQKLFGSAFQFVAFAVVFIAGS